MKEYTVAESAGYALPPVGVAGLTFMGISLPEAVQLAALLYSVIMIGEWAVRKYKGYRAWRLKQAS